MPCAPASSAGRRRSHGKPSYEMSTGRSATARAYIGLRHGIMPRRMPDLEGSHTLEIDAPIGRCFDVAADVARAPEWQGTMKSAEVLEEDADGRPALVKSEIDASVTTLTLELRFDYEEPNGMTWRRESGGLKDLRGSWTFEELGADRTRATYTLEIGLGRKLALVSKTIQGPARTKIEQLLAHRPVEGLKQRAENGA